MNPLQKQINEIQSEISTLEEGSTSKDEILKVREAQYQLLIQYMLDLKQSLKEDDEHEHENEVGDDGKIMGNNNKPEPMEVDDLYGDLY